MTLSKNINPSLVLVQPRKTRPFISERLLMGRKESNQTNNIFSDEVCTSSTIQCGTSNQCIPPSSKCDGRKDCQNGWDEGNCGKF